MNGASGAMLCPSSLMREGEPRECGAYDALGMRRVCWNAVRGKAFGSPTEGGGDQCSGLRLKTLRGRMSAGTRRFSVVPEFRENWMAERQSLGPATTKKTDPTIQTQAVSTMMPTCSLPSSQPRNTPMTGFTYSKEMATSVRVFMSSQK